jgi:hypothetical protein
LLMHQYIYMDSSTDLWTACHLGTDPVWYWEKRALLPPIPPVCVIKR